MENTKQTNGISNEEKKPELENTLDGSNRLDTADQQTLRHNKGNYSK